MEMVEARRDVGAIHVAKTNLTYLALVLSPHALKQVTLTLNSWNPKWHRRSR